MKTINCIQPRDLAAALEAGDCQLIDVREPIEHAESHVHGAVLIPLGQIEPRSGELDKSKPVICMCHSGKRGRAAAEKLLGLGFTNVGNLDGGILGWKSAGMPCAAGRKIVLPLMRQVQIVAGSLVFFGTVLAVLLNPAWVYLSMFVGAGLVFAGLSGFCGMALLLARMPWNRIEANTCSRSAGCS